MFWAAAVGLPWDDPFWSSQAVETDFRDLGWPRNIIVGMAAVEDRLFILFLGAENREVTVLVDS